jgi:hypothetical protein
MDEVGGNVELPGAGLDDRVILLSPFLPRYGGAWQMGRKGRERERRRSGAG